MARTPYIIPLALLFVTFLAGAGQAATVTLAWDPNTESDLAGYKLYYGNSPRTQAPYTQTVVINDKAATTWQITLEPGGYYFALTAYDASGNESGYSAEVSAEVSPINPPGKPGRPILISP
mgnify:CR=1 FL=1